MAVSYAAIWLLAFTIPYNQACQCLFSAQAQSCQGLPCLYGKGMKTLNLSSDSWQ